MIHISGLKTETKQQMSMKQLITKLFILISFFSLEIAAIESADNPDSLIARLKNPNIKEKIEAYADVMNYYKRIKPAKAIEYGVEALQIAQKNNYGIGEGVIHYLLGVSYHAQSDYSKAMEHYQLSYNIRERLNDKVGIGESLNRIGMIYNVRGEYEKALDYCLRSVRILEQTNDLKVLAESYNHLGVIYYILNDYEKSLNISQKALKICESINEELVLAVSYEHLGLVYIKTREYDKALLHVQKSLDLRIKNNDKIGVAGSYENLAIIFRSTKKYFEALKYYNKSLELKRELNNKRGIASSISGIGLTYYKMGQPEKSLPYLLDALEIRRVLKDKRGIVSSLNMLANSYEAMEDFKNALDFHKMSDTANDSLINEQKNKAIAEYQEAFQHERRDKEILLLQKENTIQKNYQNFLLIITFLLTVIAVAISIAYRSKRKMNSVLVTHNDEVTKQKEELQRLNEQLTELIATKDKFFSIIAHDLKSPFQGLLGYSSILSQEYSTLTEEEKISFIHNIEELSNSSYRLLENLLEWSRIQTGKMNLNVENFNLLAEVFSTLSLIKQTANNKGIEFNYNIDNSIFINADKYMLTAIIRNLASNSIKFTNSGGKIDLTVEKVEHFIRFSVKDTGIGISKDSIDKLFRVDKNISTKGTANEEGTGLGLLLCKEMIERHGGAITVESEVGKGTIFTFTIPL